MLSENCQTAPIDLLQRRRLMSCHACGSELPQGAAFCPMCGVTNASQRCSIGAFQHDLAMLRSSTMASPQQAALPSTQFPSSGVPQNTPCAQPAPYTPTPLPPRRRRFRPYGAPLDTTVFSGWGFLCFFAGSVGMFPSLSVGAHSRSLFSALSSSVSLAISWDEEAETPV
jgi:hypothetical protein